MDATELLKRDHRTVDGLFERYRGLGQDQTEDRQDVVREIVRELSVHAAIEEQVLYPEIRDSVPGGQDLVDEAIREHGEVKEVLTALDGMSPDDPALDERVRALIDDVTHHVEEEERELFPKLRDAVDPERLDEMGDRMERAKGIAPTRPHPHAPSHPPGNVVAGPAAGMVDRARDAASEAMEDEE